MKLRQNPAGRKLMANIVQVIINGKDNTPAAFNRVLANTKQISKEMRSFGTVISNVGNAASSLGANAFAGLANRTASLVVTGEALALTFRKVNLTLKGTAIGLAVAGAAYGVAKVMEYRDAVEAAAEASKKLAEIQRDSSIAALFNDETRAIEELSVAHEKRLEQIKELSIAKVDAALIDRAIEAEEIRATNELTKLKLAQSQKAIDKKEAERKKKLEQDQQYAQGAVTIFGNLADAAAAFGRKGFAVWKALKIGEAIASTYAGAARALADYPWPYSIAVAAAVVAAGIANVATIAAAKPGGQAHGGLEYVPEESTFLLSKGERVIQPRQNEQLQDFLDRGGSSGGQTTMVTVNLDGRAILKYVGQASNDGRLTINARAVT